MSYREEGTEIGSCCEILKLRQEDILEAWDTIGPTRQHEEARQAGDPIETPPKDWNSARYTYTKTVPLSGKRITKEQLRKIEPTIIRCAREGLAEHYTTKDIHRIILDEISPLKCSRSLVARYVTEVRGGWHDEEPTGPKGTPGGEAPVAEEPREPKRIVVAAEKPREPEPTPETWGGQPADITLWGAQKELGCRKGTKPR
jgi:hypothetical protein